MEDERRKNDEAFRLKIIEQQGEIKALVGTTNSRIEALANDIKEHTVAIAEIRYAMWGGPRESDIGLLEKHRKLARNWTIAIAVCAFLFSALGKIISPLYDKAVTDWVFNSPSEKWSREQRRPKIRNYHIHETFTQPSSSPSE